MEKIGNLLKQHVYHSLTDLTLFAMMDIGRSKVQLVSVMFGIYNIYKGKRPKLSNNSTLKKYSDLLKSFLDGDACDLSRIDISLDGFADFTKRVILTARAIPWGCTVSYEKLADTSGFPKAVRAVANVMRNNPLPLVIPCHRVIRKDGSAGGFGGNVKGAMVNLKIKLLENERIFFPQND